MPGGVVCQLATFKCSTLESRGSFETKQDALKLAQFLSRFMIFSAGSLLRWIAPGGLLPSKPIWKDYEWENGGRTSAKQVKCLFLPMCDLNIALITTSADTRLGIAHRIAPWKRCFCGSAGALGTRPLRLPKLMTSLWRCFARFLGWGNVTCDVTARFLCYDSKELSEQARSEF